MKQVFGLNPFLKKNHYLMTVFAILLARRRKMVERKKEKTDKQFKFKN